MYNDYKKFGVKKVVRSFRDLEVYQKTLECSVLVAKDITPVIRKIGLEELRNEFKKERAEWHKWAVAQRMAAQFRHWDDMVNCAMTIPLNISEAHSIRFGDHKTGLLLLEKAMAGCNKMVVYLEMAKGLYGASLSGDLVDDLIRRYADVRTKIFHLEKSWQKWNAPGK